MNRVLIILMLLFFLSMDAVSRTKPDASREGLPSGLRRCQGDSGIVVVKSLGTEGCVVPSDLDQNLKKQGVLPALENLAKNNPKRMTKIIDLYKSIFDKGKLVDFGNPDFGEQLSDLWKLIGKLHKKDSTLGEQVIAVLNQRGYLVERAFNRNFHNRLEGTIYFVDFSTLRKYMIPPQPGGIDRSEGAGTTR